jgi:hypothetical protein
MGFGRGLLLWILGIPFRSSSCSRCSGAEAPISSCARDVVGVRWNRHTRTPSIGASWAGFSRCAIAARVRLSACCGGARCQRC